MNKHKDSSMHFRGLFLVLDVFYWFCTKQNRVLVSLVRADLADDVTSMTEEGRKKHFIYLVVNWHSIFGAVVPVWFDCATRALRAVVGVLPGIEHLSKLLGKLAP